MMDCEKAHKPRKPVKKIRTCLKCEKVVELEDDMRLCSVCTTTNNQNSSGYGNTRVGALYFSVWNGKKRAMS